MKLRCAAVFAVTLAPAPAFAGDHLVSAEAARAALVRAEAERARDLATLDRALASPAGARAAERLGVSVDEVRRALPTLGDEDARDLARRAEALETDPAAGLLGTVSDLLWLVILVLLIILLLRAVD